MMQASTTPAPPAPPAPPALPAQPAIPGVTTVSTGVLTKRDVNALRARGQELSDQLSSVVSRRRSIVEKLKNTSADDRVGLQQRLGVLDQRIVQLEGDIAENGRQLASLDAARATTTGVPVGFNGPNADRMVNKMVPIFVVFTLFVLAPIALSISRFLWKRGSAPRHAPASPESAQRLERMEQAIDAIAIEMERVSEGQRFVTRLLSESQRPLAIGDQQREPVPAAAQQSTGPRY